MTKRTKICDLKLGDIVTAHGGKFEIIAAPYDSICHGPKCPTTGWSVGPAGVAVARAVCIEGSTPGYFWPGSDWTFQGATFVTVSTI